MLKLSTKILTLRGDKITKIQLWVEKVRTGDILRSKEFVDSGEEDLYKFYKFQSNDDPLLDQYL